MRRRLSGCRREKRVSGTIEAVRGMHDVLPAEQRAATRARQAIEALLERHGYAAVDLPIVEPRDLYLRKLGEELAGKVYEFSFGGRELALRPEWTASVLRAYVSHMQGEPLPLRLSYAGPVFRYERPQRLTYRQFTQVGVELVGGPA
jgi:histidyl-tRNA synthetase